MPRHFAFAHLSIVAALSFGCGGASEEALRQSQGEYELGVGMMNEHNIPGAFEHLQESVHLDPDNAEAHAALGALFLLRADYTRAEQHLREALRANTALGAAGRPSLVPEVRNTLGVVFMHQRRYPEAETEFRASATDLVNRTPHLAYGNLGWVYMDTQRIDDAETALQQSVANQPNFCVGWYRLGLLQLERFRADHTCDTCLTGAEHAADRALGVQDPGCQAFQEAWSLRGRIRAQLAHHDEAVADFERCIELGADTETGHSCRNMLASGN